MKVKKKSREVYIVTRNGRRVEPNNYFSEVMARERATTLKKILRKWKDPDQHRVEVIYTAQPYEIW